MPAFTFSRPNAREMDEFTLKRSPDTVHAMKFNHFVALCDGCRDGRSMDVGHRGKMLHHG